MRIKKHPKIKGNNGTLYRTSAPKTGVVKPISTANNKVKDIHKIIKLHSPFLGFLKKIIERKIVNNKK